MGCQAEASYFLRIIMFLRIAYWLGNLFNDIRGETSACAQDGPLRSQNGHGCPSYVQYIYPMLRHRMIRHVPLKVCFSIAQYPVRWTVQTALHLLPSPGRPVRSDINSASPGSILAMQQLRATTKSLTFPPLSIAR